MTSESTNKMAPVDFVYVCTGGNDARYVRICVASVRYFYPAVPIRLLIAGEMQAGLEEELRQYWQVERSDIAKGEYGWGFTHLEPLFRKPGERFLVLDSDTVITGPVLDFAVRHDEDFLIDDETQSPEGEKSNYYDRDQAAEEGHPIRKPAFLFNAGQWFGRSGLLTRQDFEGLIVWEFPRRVCNPRVFRPGDQGVFNYVVNERFADGKISVARIPLMCWPGFGMQGLNAKMVSRHMAPPLVVHWAGMKKPRLRDMVGGDILEFFERVYFERLPRGSSRRMVASVRHTWSEWMSAIRVRTMLTWRRLFAAHRLGTSSSA